MIAKSGVGEQSRKQKNKKGTYLLPGAATPSGVGLADNDNRFEPPFLNNVFALDKYLLNPFFSSAAAAGPMLADELMVWWMVFSQSKVLSRWSTRPLDFS